MLFGCDLGVDYYFPLAVSLSQRARYRGTCMQTTKHTCELCL